MQSPDSLISFYKFIPGIRTPIPADRAVGGSLPVRAYRYCEPICTASSYGWYVFTPMDFELLWDVNDIYWRINEGDEWAHLESAQFPGFSDYFDSNSPNVVHGYAPPFLGAAPEPGLVQVWTGLAVRTQPGWSTLVRPPVNVATSHSFCSFEGVIETDSWFGPLFTTIKLQKTGEPIKFRQSIPFLQLQLMETSLYKNQNTKDYEVHDFLSDVPEERWEDYFNTIVKPTKTEIRAKGQYAKMARKKSRCPVSHTV